MVQNLSQQGLTGSPAANMLSFGTPIGLGLEGGTPSQLNLPTPGMLGGIAMNHSLSDLGITTGGINAGVQKRNEDEDRRTRLRTILKKIGKPKGRVSEEGIARVSRRVGFANDVDAEKLSKEELERRVGNRAISIAGNTVVIDVELKDHVPQSVLVAYSRTGKALEIEAEAASKVLLADLNAPAGIMLNAKLERFATNMERLARVDRMSNEHINCFEAIAGMYESLRRLYEEEKKTSKEIDVMCKQSGRPSIHAYGRLGLSVEYWRDDRQSSDTKQNERASEVHGGDNPSTVLEETHDFKLYIEIEPASAALYPSLRVSDTWLPDPLDLASMQSVEDIPWQDPPPTLVPTAATGAGADAIAMGGEQRLPDLRFVAQFDPPITVPLQVANTIFQACGLSAPQVYVAYHYIDMLVHKHPRPVNPMGLHEVHITASQEVLNVVGDKEKLVSHRYDLEALKAEFGYKIETLPFSHPRQVIEILPILRQWACAGSMLKHALGDSDLEKQIGAAAPQAAAAHLQEQLSLQDLLTPPTTPLDVAAEAVPISMSLLTSPAPSLTLSFPHPTKHELHSVGVQVLPNAELAVKLGDAASVPGNDDESLEAKKVARALDLCGDLGVWVEWMRRAA